jgi:uridine kinase
MNWLSKTLEAHLARIPSTRVPIIGIDGIDAAGKTQFSAAIVTTLEQIGRKCCLVHIDDFHNPKDVRYEGNDEVKKYYFQSFAYERLVDSILQPIRQAGRLDVELNLLDLKTDTFSLRKRFYVTPQTVVVLEGVFLFRPELINFIDIRIFLRVSFEESLARARKRDLHIPPTEVASRYATKYHAAQRHYFQLVHPEEHAHIIIENDDYARPVLIADKLQPS